MQWLKSWITAIYLVLKHGPNKAMKLAEKELEELSVMERELLGASKNLEQLINSLSELKEKENACTKK